jgi:NitT/TauT family transport system permease protein
MGALLPLMLILFSTGEKQKVMFIFFAIVPFVFSDTVKAVSIVPERYVETAQTLGASNRQILAKVLVPLALPDIITSIRFQVGLALGYIMLAEAVDTPNGLGMMIATSQREYRTENVYMLLFVIAILAFLLDLVLRTVQRGAFAWRKDL